MILIVAGVPGSGKATVAAMLAGHLHWNFADGDDFHPAANAPGILEAPVLGEDGSRQGR